MVNGTCNSLSNDWSHNSPIDVQAIALYSNSVLGWDIVRCFCELHEIRFLSKKMQYPLVERMSSVQLDQVALEKACISNAEFF